MRPLQLLIAVTSLLALALSGCQSAVGSRPLVKPYGLMPGDTIALVAPAGSRDLEAVDHAAKTLEERGYKVVRAEQVASVYGYLAGTDDERASALMEAFKNPEVDAIFPVTGGYGVTRILDKLDWDVIRAHPKIVVGFSDLTGLHLAMARRAGVVSFHSPFAAWMYGDNDVPNWSADRFWRAIEAPKYPAIEKGWVIGAEGLEAKPVKMVGGKAQGRLEGGNLSLIAATMGTPYEIDCRGAILFVEDVHEQPYRVDRMLSTMEMAGKFKQVKGVVVGMFRDCEAEHPEESLTLTQVFERYFANLGVPVLTDFPVGHVRDNATMPIGVMAELDADAGTLRILENPIELPKP